MIEPDEESIRNDLVSKIRMSIEEYHTESDGYLSDAEFAEVLLPYVVSRLREECTSDEILSLVSGHISSHDEWFGQSTKADIGCEP